LPSPTPVPSPTLFRSQAQRDEFGPPTVFVADSRHDGHSDADTQRVSRHDHGNGFPMVRLADQAHAERGDHRPHDSGENAPHDPRSEEHTSELQSRENL